MQSLHYNNGSIKLTRERATIVSRWEANEVARWIGGYLNNKEKTHTHTRYFHFLFVKVLLEFKVI